MRKGIRQQSAKGGRVTDYLANGAEPKISASAIDDNGD